MVDGSEYEFEILVSCHKFCSCYICARLATICLTKGELKTVQTLDFVLQNCEISEEAFLRLF